MYSKLSGMTGTAMTEEAEFEEIYKLDVIAIPTNKPMIRQDQNKEASIIAQAGKYGAVTIFTNMAGCGTDIMLGGNSEFLAKQEMRKKGYSEELIEQANAFNDTDNEEVLSARKLFREL